MDLILENNYGVFLQIIARLTFNILRQFTEVQSFHCIVGSGTRLMFWSCPEPLTPSSQVDPACVSPFQGGRLCRSLSLLSVARHAVLLISNITVLSDCWTPGGQAWKEAATLSS